MSWASREASIRDRVTMCADQERARHPAGHDVCSAKGFAVLLPNNVCISSPPTETFSVETVKALRDGCREGQEYHTLTSNFCQLADVLKRLQKPLLLGKSGGFSKPKSGTTDHTRQFPVDVWYIILSYSDNDVVIASPTISRLHLEASDELKWAVLYNRFCRRGGQSKTTTTRDNSYKSYFAAVARKARYSVPELHQFLTALPTGSITIGTNKYTLSGATGESLMFRSFKARNRFVHIQEGSEGVLFVTFLDFGLNGHTLPKFSISEYTNVYLPYILDQQRQH